jgi:hypothetical protein
MISNVQSYEERALLDGRGEQYRPAVAACFRACGK